MYGMCTFQSSSWTVCLMCPANRSFPNLGARESRYVAVPLSKRKPPSLQKNATLTMRLFNNNGNRTADKAGR